MAAGDRIRAIREISDILARSERGDIDLVLEQHGLPTSPGSWESDSSAYVREMIRTAEDQSLSELLAFVRDSGDGVVEPSEGGYAEIWQSQFYPPEVRFLRLFLSHRHTHKAVMGGLKTALLPYGVSAFVAHVNIRPTRPWELKVIDGLRSCDALLAYMTADSRESLWTDQEVGFAVARDILIIPVRAGANPHGFVGKVQGVQGIGRTANALAAEVFELLRGNSRTRPKLEQALVDLLCHAGSYDEAKRLLNLVKDNASSSWTPAMIGELRDAIDTNSQLQGWWRWEEKTVAEEAMRLLDAL